jgi:hypothetical protein
MEKRSIKEMKDRFALGNIAASAYPVSKLSWLVLEQSVRNVLLDGDTCSSRLRWISLYLT